MSNPPRKTTFVRKASMATFATAMFRKTNAAPATSSTRGTLATIFGGAKSSKLKNEITEGWLATATSHKPPSGVCLLILDPQNDFHQGGAMAVPKAEEVSARIAQLLTQHGEKLDDIFVSLQQRPSYHIGHPSFWQDFKGNAPEPFIHIDSSDFEKKTYFPIVNDHVPYARKYFEALASKEVRNIVVFPEHCLIGSKGAAVVDVIATALKNWEKTNTKSVRYFTKSTSGRVEQFSAFSGVVDMKEDDASRFNRDLLQKLTQYRRVIVCGFTMSHQMKFTVSDFLDRTTPEKTNTALVVMTDMCATLRDFANVSQHFLESLKTHYENDARVLVSSSKNSGNVFENVPQDIRIKRQGSNAASGIEDRNIEVEVPRTQEEFFDFDTHGTSLLGDGCFLCYNETNYGSLAAVWIRGKPSNSMSDNEFSMLMNSVAFFKPGLGVTIPDFKYQNPGSDVMVREISKGGGGDGRRKKLFKGILRFLQECRRLNGSFMLRAGDESDELYDFGLYALDYNGAIKPVDGEQFTSVMDYEVVSCIPKSAHAYKGVAKQTKQVFIQTGEHIGATLEFK